MQFDQCLMVIGEFGCYQKRVFFLLCLTIVAVGFHMLSSVILLGVPKYRCQIPGYTNDTFDIQNDHHRFLINVTIPKKINEDDNDKYEGCDVFVVNTSNLHYARGDKVACNTWVYDTAVFGSTFASENNLVCDKAILTASGSMSVFFGRLVGSFFLGWLADVIGRKKALCISIMILLLSSTAIAWSRDFYIFCVLRFLVGIGCVGLDNTAFILGVELVGPAWRAWIGIIKVFFFTVGLLALAIISYAIRDWKYIEITGSFPCAFFLLYWWCIPESPRWLINRGKLKEAKSILIKMAKGNGTTVSKKQLDELQRDRSSSSGKLWHLFTRRDLILRTFIIFFNWLVASMVYYGFSLNTRNLSGDFYLNLALSGFAEIPAHIICIVLLNRVGRKRTHVPLMLFGGVACILTIVTSLFLGKHLQFITVALALLGKVGATAAFSVLYIWTTELFPTVVRNAGMGASATCSGIGGLLSPLIVDMSNFIDGHIGKAMPLVIFGSLSVLAGVLSLTLPETLNKMLPDTIEDVKNFKEWNKKKPLIPINGNREDGIPLKSITKT